MGRVFGTENTVSQGCTDIGDACYAGIIDLAEERNSMGFIKYFIFRYLC